jgi:hypothetical protein
MWTVPEGKDIARTSKLEDAQKILKYEKFPNLVSKCTELLIMSHIMRLFFGY